VERFLEEEAVACVSGSPKEICRCPFQAFQIPGGVASPTVNDTVHAFHIVGHADQISDQGMDLAIEVHDCLLAN
jgi:hypothetical protein